MMVQDPSGKLLKEMIEEAQVRCGAGALLA